MILVDTSVWIDYLRAGDTELAQQLQQNQVLMHPMVLGELALGNLKDRQLLLGLWQTLPSIQSATDAQVLASIEVQN